MSTDLRDYHDDDFTGHGYYLVTYQRVRPPAGPYPTERELCWTEELFDYPHNGYVVTWDGDVLGSVPSLNPDNFLPTCPDCDSCDVHYYPDDTVGMLDCADCGAAWMPDKGLSIRF